MNTMPVVERINENEYKTLHPPGSIIWRPFTFPDKLDSATERGGLVRFSTDGRRAGIREPVMSNYRGRGVVIGWPAVIVGLEDADPDHTHYRVHYYRGVTAFVTPESIPLSVYIQFRQACREIMDRTPDIQTQLIQTAALGLPVVGRRQFAYIHGESQYASIRVADDRPVRRATHTRVRV